VKRHIPGASGRTRNSPGFNGLESITRLLRRVLDLLQVASFKIGVNVLLNPEIGNSAARSQRYFCMRQIFFADAT